MKNKIKNILIIILIIAVSTVTSVMANTLIDSKEVIYDNKKSGMESTNVQSAVDELYSAATDYASIAAKLTQLESKLEDKTKWHLISNDVVRLKAEDNSIGTFDLSNYSEIYINFVYLNLTGGGLTEAGVTIPIIDSTSTFSITSFSYGESISGLIDFYANPSSDKGKFNIKAYAFKYNGLYVNVTGIYAR